MEKIFVDTSALFAMLAEEDSQHHSAVQNWKNLIEKESLLFSNNYVLVECLTLIQNRLGIEFVNHLSLSIVPFLTMEWIDEEMHEETMNNLLASNRRSVSLVDHSSFDTMRRLDIHTAFTFDPHFREQGFNIIP